MAKKYEYVRKYKSYNGKTYEGYGKTEAEAYEKLMEKIAAAKRGENTIDSSMTVNAWFEKWLKIYKSKKKLTKKSLKMYNEKYGKYIKPRIGNMKLKDVRDVHLQDILNEQEGMSDSHVKKVRSVMQQLFKRARQSRIILYDPAEGLELPSAYKKKRRSVTEEERVAILAVADTHRSGPWIKTLLYTGMRPGETAALRWEDVNFDSNEIHVHAAKESGTHNKIKSAKTDAGDRIIPIHADLRPVLLGMPRSKNGYVFVNLAGNRHNENSLRRLWTSFHRDLDIYMGAKLYRNQIIESAVAPDLVTYCLRHTFCTDLQRAGVPINVAKELMGHADIQTTANIYTHKASDLLHESIQMLDGTAKKRASRETTRENK